MKKYLVTVELSRIETKEIGVEVEAENTAEAFWEAIHRIPKGPDYEDWTDYCTLDAKELSDE